MTSGQDAVKDRVRARAERGEFLGQLLAVSRGQSKDVHEDFIQQLTRLAKHLRELFASEGLIRLCAIAPREYWKSVAGRRVAFVDGGVARIELPSAAPMGIRVGSYTVRIGDSTDQRESFSTDLSLVDELYSNDSWTYEDVFEDTQKMTDAARIIGEASAALKLIKNNSDLSAVFLHGPLINPVAPYGTVGFPAFKLDAARELADEPSREFTDRERHFVALYRLILEQIAKSGCPTAGIVERSVSKHPVVLLRQLSHLRELNVLSVKAAQDLHDQILEYRLNDASALSVLLATGEYLAPISINRQLPENKWPNDWRLHIEAYPQALTTYLKSAEETEPFRIEMNSGESNPVWLIELVYQTARLLPNYGFPVGLDIADKYAKVPEWMSKGIRKEHAIALLKHALKSGEPKVVEFAKKVLAAKGRDWLYRPKA